MQYFLLRWRQAEHLDILDFDGCTDYFVLCSIEVFFEDRSQASILMLQWWWRFCAAWSGGVSALAQRHPGVRAVQKHMKDQDCNGFRISSELHVENFNFGNQPWTGSVCRWTKASAWRCLHRTSLWTSACRSCPFQEVGHEFHSGKRSSAALAFIERHSTAENGPSRMIPGQQKLTDLVGTCWVHSHQPPFHLCFWGKTDHDWTGRKEPAEKGPQFPQAQTVFLFEMQKSCLWLPVILFRSFEVAEFATLSRPSGSCLGVAHSEFRTKPTVCLWQNR